MVGSLGRWTLPMVAVAVVACGGDAPSDAPSTDPEAFVVGEVLVAPGPESAQLFGVAGGALLQSGGFVVADEGNARLLFFDASGRPTGEAGGEGDGPGEFRILQAVGAGRADSVWAFDYAHRRISYFDTEGRLLRAVTLQDPPSTAAVVGGWDDGTFLVRQLWGSSEGVGGPGLFRAPVAFVRFDGDGRRVDSLTAVPGREVLLRLEDGRRVMGTAPYARDAAAALLPGGFLVGDQTAYAVEVWSREGRRLARVTWEGPDLTLGPEAVSAWIKAQIGSVPAPERPSVRAYLAEAPVPEHRPAYGVVVSGPAGGFWVGAYAPPGEEAAAWEAFDASGRRLGTVRMPPLFRPLDVAGDRLLGVRRDASGVEWVEVRRLSAGHR